jgi:hypothetical protein
MSKYAQIVSGIEERKIRWASREKMIARYVGYMALGVLLVVALIGAYYLGK